MRAEGRHNGVSLVRLRLETGRTHQIRVHLASIKRPVAGDRAYGPKDVKLHRGGQLLHAKTLTLRHPSTGEEMVFEAPLPDYFEHALQKLRAALVPESAD